VPQVIGGEVANLTVQGTKDLLHTSFGQNVSMPNIKIANYLRDAVQAKAVAIVYVKTTSARAGAIPL
jgi:branched-chain amino acid transport system substrate-binding protein